MKTITYNKLIRDRIPEIIEASGKTAVVEQLTDDEFLQKLDEKLVEELAEYQESQSVEELADLYEIILAIAAVKGYSPEEFEAIRREKAAQRGSFSQRLLLNRVIDSAVVV
jgi:predicted house-cleaning noncanonical NTP pyrophosphatase (MazG superfamily)